MNLAEKMTEYEIYYDKMQQLEKEIKEEIVSLGKSQKVGRVVGTFYPDGKGSYDWESIAKSTEPDDLLIEANTEVLVSVKWKKIAEAMNASDELISRFYTPGKPFVSLSVK